LLIILKVGLLNAQSAQSANATILSNFNPNGIKTINYSEPNNGIDGSCYFFDNEYHEGEIWLTQNRHFSKEFKYKFDQMAGSVQVLYPNGKELLIDIKEIKDFQMFVEEKTMTFVKTKLPHSDEMRVMQVIYRSPKMQLLRDIKKELIKKDTDGLYISNKTGYKIINDYSYFFSKNKDALTTIIPNKKGFVKVLPYKEKDIVVLFKKVKFKKELTVSKLAELMQKLDVGE
jgi:hypothetical protein